MSIHLNVNEVFGATCQGEGRHAGALASFLRLSGCNLSCSWCDTPYTWDWTRFDHKAETHQMSIDEVVAVLRPLPGRIVVSGGEPLLQAPALAALIKALPLRHWDLETNGTRPLGATQHQWSTVTASPKVPRSAKQDQSVASIVHPSIQEVADFKFVIRDQLDLEDVLHWLDAHPLIKRERVWLMPEGITSGTLTIRTPFVINAAVAHGFNFTSRLHVYGWADVRGH